MESKQQNLMQTLHERRVANFKNQFRSVVLEGLEIFGSEVVDEVYHECKGIFADYLTNLKVSNE